LPFDQTFDKLSFLKDQQDPHTAIYEKVQDAKCIEFLEEQQRSHFGKTQLYGSIENIAQFRQATVKHSRMANPFNFNINRSSNATECK